MFFSPKNKETALGMYTPLYFITLAVFIILIIVALFLTRKLKHENVKNIITASGIFMWLTEFGKMIFVGITYGIDEIEFIPLYYCSMFMYACVFFNFKNLHFKNAALSFFFFGGIIGATAFFAYPSAVIPNYHLFHYMTIRTFIYHSLMIYIGFLIIITGFYKPSIKHFKEYSIFMGITFICAYILNLIEGTNLMYISKPLGLEISKIIYNAVPNLYPFLFAILQLIVPFFVSYGFYNLFLLYKTKGVKK